MSPCCQGLVSRLGSIPWIRATISVPVRPMTRTPGHHATNPAKNPQNEPRVLCVHTYSEPSSGNMRPSCAVTRAPGIRKVRNPRTQYTNIPGPANCTLDEFVTNRTRATKMTTLPTSVGATFSEIMVRSSPVISAATATPPTNPAGGVLAAPGSAFLRATDARLTDDDRCPTPAVLCLIS